MDWLRRHLVLPTLQNVAAAAAIGIAALGGQSLLIESGGCEQDVIAELIEGERRLTTGKLQLAENFASDALAKRPKSRCANELLASIYNHRRVTAIEDNDQPLADDMRKRCYAHALRAEPRLGRSARALSLIQDCKAQG